MRLLGALKHHLNPDLYIEEGQRSVKIRQMRLRRSNLEIEQLLPRMGRDQTYLGCANARQFFQCASSRALPSYSNSSQPWQNHLELISTARESPRLVAVRFHQTICCVQCAPFLSHSQLTEVGRRGITHIRAEKQEDSEPSAREARQ